MVAYYLSGSHRYTENAPATGRRQYLQKPPGALKVFLIISPEPEDPYSPPEKIVFEQKQKMLPVIPAPGTDDKGEAQCTDR
jgi:hypothetical protein